jgi:hypothetical protein
LYVPAGGHHAFSFADFAVNVGIFDFVMETAYCDRKTYFFEVEASYVPMSGAFIFFFICQSSYFGVFHRGALAGRL